MDQQIRKILESEPIAASAPCRIDMGGTLDISTFSYPLRCLAPCTFNIALELRTRVRLQAFSRGRIKISSRGFKDAQFSADAAPFDHPLGLMFATAAYFNARRYSYRYRLPISSTQCTGRVICCGCGADCGIFKVVGT